MWISRSQLTALSIALCLLASCAATQTHFEERRALTADFYADLLRDTCNNVALKSAVPDVIERVVLYRTSFREKGVETGSVVTSASLNDSSSREKASYTYILGYRQDLYLARVQGKCHPDTWIYFSVLYQASSKSPVQEQIGFGKAYLGIQDESDKTIHFTHALLVKSGKDGYYLSYKDTARFFFVADDLERGVRPVRVNRIVVEEHNKFGGPEAFVFKVAKHFPNELQALIFTRVAAFNRP